MENQTITHASNSSSKSYKNKKKRNNRKSSSGATGGSRNVPDQKTGAQDLVAAVAAVVSPSSESNTHHDDCIPSETNEQSTKLKQTMGVESKSTNPNTTPKSSQPNTPQRARSNRSKQANTSSKSARVAPTTPNVDSCPVDSLDSLIDGNGCRVDDKDSKTAPEDHTVAVPLVSTEVLSLPPQTESFLASSPDTEAIIHPAAVVSESSKSRVDMKPFPSEAEGSCLTDDSLLLDKDFKSILEAHYVDTPTFLPQGHSEINSAATSASVDCENDTENASCGVSIVDPPSLPITATSISATMRPASVASFDDDWSRKSTVNTESVLSESEALSLADDPLVIAARSLSNDEPMDTYAEALAKGIECEVHGLVIPYGWTWCHDGSILRAYTHLAEEIHALESEVDFADRCCYVYAPSELHCTVATLSSFKEPTSFFSTLNSSATNDSRSPEVLLALRRGIMMLWRDAINRQFTAPVSSPRATVSRVEVCESAIIFHLTPMDDTLERMRAAVRAAAEDFTFREYEISNGLSPYELTRLIHIPNITHSTFVRFRKRPSVEMIRRLEETVAKWTPCVVEMFGMKLVYENRPYMHVDMEHTIVMKIDGKRSVSPQEPLTSLEPPTTRVAPASPKSGVVAFTTECELSSEQQGAHSEEKAIPAAPKIAAPSQVNTSIPVPVTTSSSMKNAYAAVPATTSVPASATSSPSAPTAAQDSSSSMQNLLFAGVVAAGLAGVIAMVLLRKK